jgi:hypothetical protein
MVPEAMHVPSVAATRPIIKVERVLLEKEESTSRGVCTAKTRKGK